MCPVLRKIALRKLRNEKGRSLCVIFAVFLTTVLFIMIFSGVFFVKGALKELAGNSASWTADAAFIVSEDEYQKMSKSSMVAEISAGLHIGEITDSGGYVEIELVYYEEKIAHWMKCYPTVGRLPDRGNEIVVSKQYLEQHHMQYEENAPVTVTYETDGIVRTDTFTLVGTYDREPQNKNLMLLSEDYYEHMSAQLSELGKDSEAILYRLAEVVYCSPGDVEKTTNRFIAETGFDISSGYAINGSSGRNISPGIGGIAVVALLILFVVIIGYLFISNIFSISIRQDISFYGKLSTNGMTGAEIRSMIMLQYHVLYLLSVLPAMLIGFVFTCRTLPGILASFFTFQVETRADIRIFLLGALFSYVTLFISAGKPVKMAGKVSPIRMKRSFLQMKPVCKSDHRSCLGKLILRGFRNDRKAAVKIYLSIAASILLANLFYTIVKGFDEQEYLSKDFVADYTIASTSFYTQQDTRERVNISQEELMPCTALPGLEESGGGGVCPADIVLGEKSAEEYEAIAGDTNLNNDYGYMLTNVYGLDDIMVRKMTVLEGNIDPELFRSGNYVIIDALDGEGRTCFHIGDRITIPFQNGNSAAYTVMAIAELPYAISFQSKYVASSNLFLPYGEWSRQTGRSDYYMYTYDVRPDCRELWDETLERMTETDGGLRYRSAGTVAEDSREFLNEIKTVGIVLSVILLSMGVLNFMNCIATGVYSRRREFAVMQSMGMKRLEIIRALIGEGMLYIMGGFAAGCLISIPGIYLMITALLGGACVRYRFYFMPYAVFAGLGIVMAVLVPYASYLYMDKKETFLSRIRACRE